MKKIFSVLIILVVFCCLLAVPVSAASDGSMSMDAASGNRGDTVTLSVNLDNNPGLVTMTIRVSYDTSVLQLTNVSDAGLLAGAYGCRMEMMQNVMVGGLLHDSGCLEMTFLIGKKERTPQEELLWKEHPTYGHYFAIQNELPREMAEIIQYHE